MREYVWLECTECKDRQLPGPEGNPGRRPARAEEVLPARAEAHAPQGVAEEVTAPAPPAPLPRRPPQARAGGQGVR